LWQLYKKPSAQAGVFGDGRGENKFVFHLK
jgi:hypothetical protein